MIGLDGRRVYLDWNATAPLRPEARAAMLEAMDAVGNPSSVHAEGRAARAIVERARGQVARLVGCEPDEVIFTSGATEGAHLALCEACDGILFMAPTEHDCVWFDACPEVHPVRTDGRLDWSNDVIEYISGRLTIHDTIVIPVANSETGVIEDYIRAISDFVDFMNRRDRSVGMLKKNGCMVVLDPTQAVGKIDYEARTSGADIQFCSGHKIGAPKGVGAVVADPRIEFRFSFDGGRQERGKRSGTENVIGIAGFGAAAEAARRDLEDGVWARVEKLRNILEERLAAAARKAIFFGQDCPRLPNTSCFAVPGWRGETQVMALDLAGFAVSAGSACSSGKVAKASRVLLAMGFDEVTASSAIRVSMGPTTTEAEVMAFADTWTEMYRRWETRAA